MMALGAPVLSILTAILITLVIWRLTQWAFARQIEGLRDQIKALDERLSLAREKFDRAEELAQARRDRGESE